MWTEPGRGARSRGDTRVQVSGSPGWWRVELFFMLVGGWWGTLATRNPPPFFGFGRTITFGGNPCLYPPCGVLIRRPLCLRGALH